MQDDRILARISEQADKKAQIKLPDEFGKIGRMLFAITSFRVLVKGSSHPRDLAKGDSVLLASLTEIAVKPGSPALFVIDGIEGKEAKP